LSYDVAVIGLGTAGAAAASLCAQNGLRVVGLESGALTRAGARWVNAVPGWHFDQATIARPTGPELLGNGGTMHLVAGWGPTRVRLRTSDVLEVDMRALVQRLQDDASRAGAHIRGDVRVQRVTDTGVETSSGPVDARWIVDASGLAGLRLLVQQRPEPTNICVAAQGVHQITDREAAHDFFAKHDVPVGETLCFSGIAGGYSIVNVRLHADEVFLLTGSVPADGVPSGPELLASFCSTHPWVGERLFGGQRALPLQRPPAFVGRDRVAAIGDAASQVYGPHGSGIGQQLMAARILAEQFASGAGPDGYNMQWQRERGGLLASVDLFRRFSQYLKPDDLQRMMAGGVFQPELFSQGLSQRDARPSPIEALKAVIGLARVPRLAAGMLPVLLKTPLIELHYSRYPSDPAKVGKWTRRLDRLTGVQTKP